MNTPAYKAGLDKGDIIISINNKPFPKGQSFDAYIKQLKVGDHLSIDFIRFEEIKQLL